jgi:hypothetical protein
VARVEWLLIVAKNENQKNSFARYRALLLPGKRVPRQGWKGLFG